MAYFRIFRLVRQNISDGPSFWSKNQNDKYGIKNIILILMFINYMINQTAIEPFSLKNSTNRQFVPKLFMMLIIQYV